MFDWPFNLWGSRARHELTLEDVHEAQDRLKNEKIALEKEIKDIKKQLKASDLAYKEKSKLLESEACKYHKDIQLLQRQADHKHSTDFTKIRQLERGVAECCRQNKILREENEVLRRENKAFQHAAELNERRHLLDAEKSRRQHELLSQAEIRAEENEKAHRGTLNELYNEINSLQIGQAQMNDEQISGIMRKLGHDLDSWVKLHFIYPQTEEPCNFPYNSLQLQAWIQAGIVNMIHSHIFAPYHFGIHDDSGGHFIGVLKDGIENIVSEKALRTWQTITCDFLEESTKDEREGLICDIIDQVEKQFGKFSPTDDKLRQHQFQELVQGCANFKTALSRQQARYLLYCNPMGSEFSWEFMAFGGGDGGGTGNAQYEGINEVGTVIQKDIYQVTPRSTIIHHASIAPSRPPNLPCILSMEIIQRIKKDMTILMPLIARTVELALRVSRLALPSVLNRSRPRISCQVDILCHQELEMLGSLREILSGA
ncbi:uncharacterized protein KD926_003810 [Aspergillus affinis]|uniref:uncharacterized protein n=1 Tax=Aspergillus affinis TaxID=1070780 RepID=UPI0022FED744|nr:uncharacterized protein KD926_003810 [Aspergillus affinis]KAI9043280.1 hypothetical protein KD926_003810 [Aspergillus affinis]